MDGSTIQQKVAGFCKSRALFETLADSLDDAGKPQEAERTRNLSSELGAVIDRLQSGSLLMWDSNADRVGAEISLHNGELQKCIDDIQGQMNLLQKIVDAVGICDQIVKKVTQAFPV